MSVIVIVVTFFKYIHLIIDTSWDKISLDVKLVRGRVQNVTVKP